MPPAGQRRLALAVAVAISLVASAAIYLLHRTMPLPAGAPPLPPARFAPGQQTAPAGAPTREASTTGETPGAGAGAGAGAVDAPPAAREAAAPIETITQSGSHASTRAVPAASDTAVAVSPPTHIRESGAPVSLRVPMPDTAPPEPEPRGAAPITTDRRERPLARQQQQQPMQTPPTAARTGPPARARPAEKSGQGVTAPASDAVAPATPTARATESAAPPMPAPARTPQRLAAQQQAQCAGSEFVARFICDERVRLRFCRDRWNEHPDCNVETPRNNNY